MRGGPSSGSMVYRARELGLGNCESGEGRQGNLWITERAGRGRGGRRGQSAVGACRTGLQIQVWGICGAAPTAHHSRTPTPVLPVPQDVLAFHNNPSTLLSHCSRLYLRSRSMPLTSTASCSSLRTKQARLVPRKCPSPTPQPLHTSLHTSTPVFAVTQHAPALHCQLQQPQHKAKARLIPPKCS